MNDLKRITSKNLILFFLLKGVALLFPGFALADWESDLKERFDIVDTFDNLQDWRGKNGTRGTSIQDDPSEMPRKLDGSPSIWQYYYIGVAAEFFDTDWIRDHGPENVWRRTGKSAIIDYGIGGSALETDVKGPGRLGFKIGDSPDDGYTSTVHVFFMSKWPRSFFRTTGDNFNYHEFVKVLDISAGFRTVREFGTSAEQDWLRNNCSAPYPLTQVLNEYGMNAQVYNLYAYGSSREVLLNTILVPQEPGEPVPYCAYNGSNQKIYTDAEVGQAILRDEWFGLEYRVKMSSPHGSDNGEFEIWVYNSNGEVVSHQLDTGVVNFKDGGTVFNHAWNKFIWGGNRFDGLYCPLSNRPGCSFGETEHFYLDDVIVHGSRIGPTYFALLRGNSPNPPTSLRIISE